MSKSATEYGGSLTRGKRKTKRPLCEKSSTHLVLKSNRMIEFYDHFTWITARKPIERILRYQANRFKIKIYEIAIQADHLHASIRFKKRQDYVRFIRAVTAHIIKTLSRLLKINLKGLFDVLPYTKIVKWGIQYRRTINYILINQLESLGFKNVRGGWFYDDWSKDRTSTSRRLVLEV